MQNPDTLAVSQFAMGRFADVPESAPEGTAVCNLNDRKDNELHFPQTRIIVCQQK